MRIVCSLVSVTVIFQLELFIILNVNYRNVCSSNQPQLRVLPGSSISAPWRVDFRNWQVDYWDAEVDESTLRLFVTGVH